MYILWYNFNLHYTVDISPFSSIDFQVFIRKKSKTHKRGVGFRSSKWTSSDGEVNTT